MRPREKCAPLWEQAVVWSLYFIRSMTSSQPSKENFTDLIRQKEEFLRVEGRFRMANNRRSQDASISRPAMKVVGFRVEGVPPSPDQVHGLQESTEGGGSPDPVIIPPSFQVQHPVKKTFCLTPFSQTGIEWGRNLLEAKLWYKEDT